MRKILADDDHVPKQATAGSEVTTKLADADERQRCYELAYEIFHEEMGTLGDEADHRRRQIRDETIENAHLICAKVGDEVVGSLGLLLGADGSFTDMFRSCFDIERYAEVVPIDQMAINIRFLVKEDYRASSIPFLLIKEAAKLQGEHGVTLSFADCQPHLLNLYNRLGFRTCADTFDQPGFGLMVPLALIAHDHGHLRLVKSPLRKQLRQFTDPDRAAEVVGLLPAQHAVSPLDGLGDLSWNEIYAVLSRPKKVSALADLSRAEVQQLLGSSRLIECSKDQKIVLHEQGTRTVYIVLRGRVEVQNHGALLAVLEEGDVFGEIAFLLQMKRTADVVAVSDDVQVIALDERSLERMITSEPALAAKFLLNLSRDLAVKLVGTAT